ncbi:MAG: lysozyme [Bacteroidia bacterium]|nr:lysozyme [Bacteroidia bacterium]
MKTSPSAIALIKSFEGFSLTAYRCPAGCLTIGYGHTSNVTEGMAINEQQAEKLLKQDICFAELAVDMLGKLTQNQYDALVSFVFNVGNRAFSSSRLRRYVLADPNDPAIRQEFLRWIYITVKGRKQISKGLQNRRNAEANLYFNTEIS